MRRPTALLLLLLILPLAAASQRRPPRPKPPKAVPQATGPQTYGLSVDRYVSSYSIKGDGSARHTLEMAQTCNIELCAARLSKVAQIFNAELQNVKLLEAGLIKKNGKKIDLTADNGVTRPTPQAESAPDFSSLRQFEISFPGYEIGDTAVYKIELETRKAIFGDHFDSLELFPAFLEWKSIDISVTAPAGYPLHFDTTGLEGGETAADGATKAWRWKKNGLAALPIETAMYDTQRTSPRFAVTTFSSFEQLGAAFGEGFRQKTVITPELQALADEVTKDLKDPGEQAAAIYQWVNKNIRYLLVVLDRGGWVPHSTDQILRNRYGDCKDYTALIYAMLKAKGIDSVPVLINSRLGNWFPKVATMEHFDHAVLYIPKLDLFADATSPNTRLGMIPQNLVGKTALQSGEKPALIFVPKDRPDDNQLLSDVEVVISEDGTLTSTVRNIFAGRSEILFRPILGDVKRPGLSDSFVKLQLAYYGLAGTGRLLEASDPHSVSEPFAIKLEVEIPDFTAFASKGSITIPPGINMLSIASLEGFAKDDRRTTDLFIGATRIRENFRIKVPEKVAFQGLPSDVKYANAVGTFDLGFKRSSGVVELRRELVIFKDTIEPSDYAAFKELIGAAVAALNAAIPYTSDGSLRAKRSAGTRRAGSNGSTYPKQFEEVVSEMFGLADTKLGSAEVLRLEAAVRARAADVSSREKLLRHYGNYEVKETPAVIRSRLEHKLWMIRNRPERATARLIGSHFRQEKNSAEFIAIRDEWKKQIASRPSDKNIWLNAVDSVQDTEPDLAQTMLTEAMELHPDAYEFPQRLTLDLVSRLQSGGDPLSPTVRSEYWKRATETGKRALVLLKKERSATRDADRAALLLSLLPIVFDSGDLELAVSLARELILDFGGETSSPNFEMAAHIGNIILGKVALAKNDLARAADHLMISIRAPLRKEDGFFTEIDLSLAAELFRRGEKKVVVEFLASAQEVSGFTEDADLFEEEISALKKWIGEIEKGSEPSFDWEKP